MKSLDKLLKKNYLRSSPWNAENPRNLPCWFSVTNNPSSYEAFSTSGKPKWAADQRRYHKRLVTTSAVRNVPIEVQLGNWFVWQARLGRTPFVHSKRSPGLASFPIYVYLSIRMIYCVLGSLIGVGVAWIIYLEEGLDLQSVLQPSKECLGY